ncbi:MAG: FadR family transcriptional regulator [Sandaracinaceae bacterium]|jgi:DNA-binding FadR family transcriptional regulator|nr:FadR family transcriptional regulator [Sandaracinaceae bacterium]MBP7683651.1 FadR family transcriptional regulator [Deltaproteobacteria bacterium]MBK6807962.1 FadR family transcriptional regulator [Sandaracinaceae bacterium]MBK7772987.1 FadR family transcriptional regulator [Sandaracinaceae bacterium]MBK8407198.1 FadR family transcriptional regulator [Sandaracinaceae bacterium]
MSETERSETTVDVLERTLVRRILRREYAPGVNLPSVRQLAAEFDVTAPTIQRVTARLEAHGLVEARHGSGVRVLDATKKGGLSLLPLWFDALSDNPQEATRVFRECMELRRLVAVHLAPRIDVVSAAPGLLAALERTREAKTVDELMEADLSFTRAVLDAAGHFGATALFNTVETVIRNVPGVADAFYGDPELLRASLSAVVGAVAQSGAERDQAMLAALERWDEQAAARFEAFVTARARENGPRSARNRA